MHIQVAISCRLLSNNLEYINDVCTSHAVGEAVIVFSGVRVCPRKTAKLLTGNSRNLM